ncbi:MAG: phospholipase D family protein, partial [Gammaproteobacteria bacterium]
QSWVESSTEDKRESWAIKDPQNTRLGKVAISIASKHTGESGFLLLDRGKDALSWRTILADAAEQTIDAQYFLWKDDDAGKIMMQRLLAAAQRGVRVRVLVDDSMTESDPEYLAVFGAHPNIELRLYKPFGPKTKSVVLRWIDYAADLKVLNHRMHNKLFVVDGSVAVVGGRNIGNEYFDYPGPMVFRSRDLLAMGPNYQENGDSL